MDEYMLRTCTNTFLSTMHLCHHIPSTRRQGQINNKQHHSNKQVEVAVVDDVYDIHPTDRSPPWSNVWPRFKDFVNGVLWHGCAPTCRMWFNKGGHRPKQCLVIDRCTSHHLQWYGCCVFFCISMEELPRLLSLSPLSFWEPKKR